ncbi:MAG: tetratricopeptide repeat protein [Treponema sp.]|nr:tetratricopeptide repeat protein [Treponema sp.]
MTEAEKLADAIAALEARRQLLGDAVVDSALGPMREKLASLSGIAKSAQISPAEERKNVTILFADVSGFTALSETLDPEEVAEIMNNLWREMDKAIIDNGGMIDKHIGDAVMALFGALGPREDHPELALDAALAMRKVMEEFSYNDRLMEGMANREGAVNGRPALRMRIGVNTGLVLLGRMGSNREFTAMGDAVNLASRMEHAAPIGGILVSHNTYRHVRGLYVVAAQAPLMVKGKKDPVQTFVVEAKRPRSFRSANRGIEGITTKMVGRDEALSSMQNAFLETREERRFHLVTVSGDAGMGKSRLIHEFQLWREAQAGRVALFHGRCVEQTRNIPFRLMRDLFLSHFGINESEGSVRCRELLETGIAGLMGPDGLEKAHFIGHLLGFDYRDSPWLKGILEDPLQIRNIAFHHMAGFFEAAVQAEGEGAVVKIILEDIHWIDEGSLDATAWLRSACSDRPIMIVCTARPTFFEAHADWDGVSILRSDGIKESNRRIDLQALASDEVRRLVADIFQMADGAPKELEDLIVDNSAGNPFYVEELVNMLVDEGFIVLGPDRWRFSPRPLSLLKVPPTLAGILQARLQGLPEAERGAIRKGAIIGKVFWDDAVSALTQIETQDTRDTSTRQALGNLEAKDLIRARKDSSFEGTAEFIFRHSLLHDVAYESVLLRDRKILHGKAAQWLLTSSGEGAPDYAGLIAEHFERANLTIDAALWFGRAADHARATYAPELAIEFYQKALNLFLLSSPNRESDYRFEGAIESTSYEEISKLEYSWRDGLGGMLSKRARYDEAIHVYQSLAEMAGRAEEKEWMARAFIGLARVRESQGDYAAMLASAEDAAGIMGSAEGLEERSRLLLMARALGLKGNALFNLGMLAKARKAGEESLSIAENFEARDQMAHAINLLGMIETTEGKTLRARELFEQALGLHRLLGDRNHEVAVLNNLGIIQRMLGEDEESLARHEENVRLSQQIGDRDMEAFAFINALSVRLRLGRSPEAIVSDSMTIMMSFGERKWLLGGVVRSILSEALTRLRRFDEGLAQALEAIRIARDNSSPEDLSLAWHSLGVVASEMPGGVIDVDPSIHEGGMVSAGECFAESVRISTESGNEDGLAETLRTWAFFEKRSGNQEKASAFYSSARDLFAKFGAAKTLAKMESEWNSI